VKYLTAIILVLALAFGLLPGARAQAAETIWMEMSTSTFSVGETLTVTLKSNSANSFQGFSFQLRYDPACLQPVAINSLVAGLNSMSVPQSAGLVDAIFASTTPLSANAALAEVKFNTLAPCQTSLNLESASLVVSDASGMAVPLQGVSVGTSTFVVNVGGAGVTGPQATTAPATSATTSPEVAATPQPDQGLRQFSWLLLPLLGLACLVMLIGLGIAAMVLSSGRKTAPAAAPHYPSAVPTLFIQRGPQAGTTLPLVVFPCRIGSDPENEICLSDPRISPAHARILPSRAGYILEDTGSQDGTFLNGQLVRSRQVPLKRGDVLRLGGVLLVFNPS
jgi:hypothetical protein